MGSQSRPAIPQTCGLFSNIRLNFNKRSFKGDPGQAFQIDVGAVGIFSKMNFQFFATTGLHLDRGLDHIFFRSQQKYENWKKVHMNNTAKNLFRISLHNCPTQLLINSLLLKVKTNPVYFF